MTLIKCPPATYALLKITTLRFKLIPPNQGQFVPNGYFKIHHFSLSGRMLKYWKIWSLQTLSNKKNKIEIPLLSTPLIHPYIKLHQMNRVTLISLTTTCQMISSLLLSSW